LLIFTFLIPITIMTTIWTTDRQIQTETKYLVWWDNDNDYLVWWDDSEDQILASTGNATVWTPRTPV
jgi:hypothetical protein